MIIKLKELHKHTWGGWGGGGVKSNSSSNTSREQKVSQKQKMNLQLNQYIAQESKHNYKEWTNVSLCYYQHIYEL